ncbi:hypothetical protein E1263_12945 [Kribbella antibiotica]|uniref:M20/M25/M40 family metallo-hydrolase n=1 Tax=Kribbella antibiotica TaxID=190195 RepID=A0A4R4ZMC5_9ACTN|nr:hypothetical protein E1263_12945 [Kribbella antibiotica]
MRREDPSGHIDGVALADFPGLRDRPVAGAPRRAGVHNESVNVAYGTEAGLVSELGVPAVVCGPGGIEQAHRPEEWGER